MTWSWRRCFFYSTIHAVKIKNCNGALIVIFEADHQKQYQPIPVTTSFQNFSHFEKTVSLVWKLRNGIVLNDIYRIIFLTWEILPIMAGYRIHSTILAKKTKLQSFTSYPQTETNVKHDNYYAVVQWKWSPNSTRRVIGKLVPSD